MSNKKSKTQAKAPAAQVPATEAPEVKAPETEAPAVEKTESKVEGIAIFNPTPYQQYDAYNHIKFPAGKTVSGLIMNDWLQAQINAKILEVVK